MKKGRLFTFGCSLTNLFWPTWADLLGLVYKEYYNFGALGAGNVYIAHTIVEADLKFNFNQNDMIIIMWSTYFRWDRYKDGNWIHHGHVWSNHHSKEDQKLFKEVWDNHYGVLQSLDSFYLIQHLLEHKHIKYYFSSFLPIEQSLGLKNDPGEDTFIFKEKFIEYSPILKANWVNDMWRYISKNDDKLKWYESHTDGKMTKDIHPTPYIAYEFLSNELLNELSLSIEEYNLIKEKAVEWNNSLMDQKLYNGNEIHLFFKEELNNLRNNIKSL